MRILLFLLTAFAVFFANLAHGDTYLIQPDPAPVKKILKSSKHTAIVLMDRGKVTVSLLGETTDKPSSLLLTFYDEDYTPTTFELKSLGPPELLEPGNPLIYAGTLPYGRVPGDGTNSASTAQSSIMGLEIRLPLPANNLEVLRLDPTE
jgi:hypothetical protein